MDESKVIVTIGRNFGSRGREVAVKLADQMNIKCYDRNILTESIKRNGMSEDLVREYDENPRNSYLRNMVDGIREYGKDSPAFSVSVQLYVKQFEIISEIAEKESCIFLGRCADYVLRNRDNLVKVYLHAPLEIRIQNIMDKYGFRKERAEEYIKKQDEIRANYYDYYTHHKWGDKKNYDLILNTYELGIDNCVNEILNYIHGHSA